MEGLVEEPSYVGLEEEDDFPDHHVGVHTFNLEIEIARLFQVVIGTENTISCFALESFLLSVYGPLE